MKPLTFCEYTTKLKKLKKLMTEQEKKLYERLLHYRKNCIHSYVSIGDSNNDHWQECYKCGHIK